MPLSQLPRSGQIQVLEPLTEDLGLGERGEVLQAPEEVAMGVRQVAMKLLEVTVPFPNGDLPRKTRNVKHFYALPLPRKPPPHKHILPPYLVATKAHTEARKSLIEFFILF